ncbi:MAG: adenylyltransferase/cytidyltransferase family protein [Ignavibacteriales bacterium]|nr:adenylyltransferase/cytidyltransferase family protein [Ignavibacteriales bacterium]
MSNKKKVFVTGCFDMLHSGHVAFFKESASYGEVYVGLGSDETVFNLKGRYPINNQNERKYMIDALACVKECLINTGSGIMDFIKEIDIVKPDIFVVNEEGNTPAKEELSKKLGIEYLVLKRLPFENLPIRSSTALREELTMPFRLDLAGGWLDQPYVGKIAAGPVLTISIEPTIEFNERSGMATSTRRKAIELWHTDVPPGNKEKLAKILFSYENPPGTKVISGSQDAIGIVMPCFNKLDYDGGFWPTKITSVLDEDILSWIENHLSLITLGPRDDLYDVLENTQISKENAEALSSAAEQCWDSILRKDLQGFGKYFKKSFEAQIKMFPNMVYDDIFKTIERYKNSAYGWKLSGAGGGGYLVFVTEHTLSGAIQLKIRRKTL